MSMVVGCVVMGREDEEGKIKLGLRPSGSSKVLIRSMVGGREPDGPLKVHCK